MRYYLCVADRFAKIEAQMRENPAGVRFSDLMRFCIEMFGPPRNSGSSHYIFKMPWPGDPRVNIQDKGTYAKPYQVKQVLAAADKLRKETN
jgi:hypothetical protein